MILIDSNVLIDVISEDPVWCEWSLAQLRLAKAQDKLTINAMVFATAITSSRTTDSSTAWAKRASPGP